jgi:urease accessory protein
MRRPLALVAIAFGCMVFSPLAAAHTGLSAEGFLSGFLHPVFGFDHFLAMLSVGIVSAQLGGWSLWTVPATFVAAMIAGAIVGAYGGPWPLSEIGIATSVIVLGISVTVVKADSPRFIVMAITAFFGCLHGHAHGVEMPLAADPVFYAGGFVVSTALIHLLGVGIGHVMTRSHHMTTILQHAGSAIAGIGLMIFIQAWRL